MTAPASVKSTRFPFPKNGAANTQTPLLPSLPPRLGDALGPSMDRVERRCAGIEKPVLLPWAVLADHFGGGLWPGVHFLNSGTGVGKTQAALQVACSSAKRGEPVLYVGLELGELDLAVRTLGIEARVPWSPLFIGKAGKAHVQKARDAIPALQVLPFHYEIGRPHGFAPSTLLAAIEAMRIEYPELDGPGSRPMLVVVDFLQLVGDEPEEDRELRIRIGRAAYVLRDAARRLNASVLCISSIARERYKLADDIVGAAGLQWDVDDNEKPINRRITRPDTIIGVGKESGDIEFSADSVSLIVKVPETFVAGHGVDVIFATPKGRATEALWSPLHFTGFGYEECADGGGRMLDAWKNAAEARSRASEAKKAAKEDKALAKIHADAEAIRDFVVKNPGCSTREARIHTVKNTSRRWTTAVALLGKALLQTKADKAAGIAAGLWIVDVPADEPEAKEEADADE